MVKKYRKRSKRNKGGLWKFVAIISGVTVVLAFFGFLTFYGLKPTIDLDTAFCPDDSLLKTNIAVIYDTTSPLVDSQLLDINNRIERVIRGLEQNEKVSFYTVTSDESSGIERVTAQRPNNDGTSTTIDHFCKAPAQDTPLQGIVADRFLEDASKRLLEAVKNQGQGYSPLLDAFRFVAATLTETSPNNRVIIVSDLIENSPTLNMYESDWVDEYRLNETSIKQQRPIFPENTSIQVLLLQRPGESAQLSDIFEEFWFDMLDANGSVDVRMRKIAGGIR